MNKQQLRKKMLNIRNNLSNVDVLLADKLLIDYFKNNNYFTGQVSISCYLAFNNEVPTKGLIDFFLQKQYHVYVPVISDCKNSLMQMASYTNLQKLNIYNISEPIIDKTNNNIVNYLDVIFMPVVAIDKQKNRLGFGKGYYDKYIANYRSINNNKLTLIALAYAFQLVDQIEIQPWDIAVDQLIIIDLINKNIKVY